MNKYSCYLVKNKETIVAADLVGTFIIVEFKGAIEWVQEIGKEHIWGTLMTSLSDCLFLSAWRRLVPPGSLVTTFLSKINSNFCETNQAT